MSARQAGIDIIPCGDDAVWHALRRQDITASVAAALLGADDPESQHAYATPYQLYMLATGAIEPEALDEEGPVLRGILMEEPAVKLLRRRNPTWIVRHNSGEGRVYYRDRAARIGATPDVIVNDPQRGLGVVQIKSVGEFAFRKKWVGEDKEVVPPLWIAVQAVVEASVVPGAVWAAVAPFRVTDGGLDMPLIDIPLHAGIMTKLRAEVTDFWRRVRENDPYDPDFGRDGELIARLYAEDDGETVDLSDHQRIGGLITQREELKEREAVGNAAAKERKAIDAEIIFALGNAARGRLADGRVVEAKTVRRGGYEVAPSSYRTVKIREAKAS
jgi:hypothetical protein